MLDQLVSLTTLAAIATAAFGLGRPIVRGLGVEQEDRLATAVWSLGLGLVAAGLLLTGLGLLGVLYAWLIGALTMIGCFWAFGELILAFGAPATSETAEDRSPVEPASASAPWAPPARWLSRTILLLAAVACLGSLVGALAPPTAGDALCYHLELPKVFLAEHSLVYLPYSDNSTFPLLTEIWYLWALALDGGVAAQLVHWGLGVLLALATVVLATPIIGRGWAWIAGAVAVLVPGVNNQMTAPLNDVALALLTTLALAAWWRAVVDLQGRRWFVVAGLAAGGALGTKYVAAIFALAVAATWAWTLVRRPQHRWLLVQGAAIVSALAVGFGGVWYVRAAVHRGNPVWPMAAELFGPGQAPPPRQETLPESKSPLGHGPRGLATAPWQITMHPERFGGRGHQLGVLFLAVLPGLAVSRRVRGLGLLLGVSGAYFLLWYLLRQNVRFLFPVVPLLAVAVVWVWIEARRYPLLPRLALGATFVVILSASAVVAATRCGDRLGVALGVESRETYLSRNEPSYPAAAVANLLLDPEARILSQDHRTFYFQRPIVRESIYRRWNHYDQRVSCPAELSRCLRQDGFTHLLLAENLDEDGPPNDTTLSRLAESPTACPADDLLVELTRYCFRDEDGRSRRYRLVQLR